MKPTIMQATKYYWPHTGGMESHIAGISEELADLGYKMKVVTSNIPASKKKQELNGVKIFRCRSYFNLSNDPFTPGAFFRLLAEEYDLLHVHLPDPFYGVYSLIASVFKNKPLVVTYHADILKKRWFERLLFFFYRPLLYLTLARAAKIIVTSGSYAGGSGVLVRFGDKVDVVPNFVDHHLFNPQNNGQQIRTKHNLLNKKTILFVGRLVPYKGVKHLIEAVKKIKDTTLLIVGDGPLKAELQKQARDSNIIFISNVSEKMLPQYYAACDLFILPSVTRQEAFGITLLEAMASAKPTITSNISGMPWVIGDCGLKIEPENPSALAKAIKSLLQDENKRKKMGSCGRTRVIDYFTKEKVAAEILKLYLNILNKTK